MPRTIPYQYRLMVDCMKQGGDLAKFTDCPNSRREAASKWEALAHRLNSMGYGETRAVDKWKRVWADLKANTKKKAAKIRQLAGRTGGGPASILKLTPIEEDVLEIMSPTAAYGIEEVACAGFDNPDVSIHDVEIEVSPTRPAPGTMPPPPPVPDYGAYFIETLSPPHPFQNFEVVADVEAAPRPRMRTTANVETAPRPRVRTPSPEIVVCDNDLSVTTSTPQKPPLKRKKKSEVEMGLHHFLKAEERSSLLEIKKLQAEKESMELRHKELDLQRTLETRRLDLESRRLESEEKKSEDLRELRLQLERQHYETMDLLKKILDALKKE